MSNHLPSRKHLTLKHLRSTRVRALLSIGIVLGFGAVGTLAYWTDSATLTGGTFQSGKLDLKLNGGDSFANTTFTAPNLQPGESIASSFPVNNAGTIDFNFTATGISSGGTAPYLLFTVKTTSTASNLGTATAGDRVGTCSGTATAFGPALLNLATAQTVIGTNQLVTVLAGSENVCIIARLDPTAPNLAQSQTTGSATFVFNAKQVGQ